MSQLARLLFIAFTLLRFGVDDMALSGVRQRWVRALARLSMIGRRFDEPRGVRLRRALERLGPIFVKFGQVLSTRRDLLPLDVADELARLQDRVPPFPGAESVRLIEQAFGRPIHETFATFEAEPVASASIAQVHFATLPGGREVAVKVLRAELADEALPDGRDLALESLRVDVDAALQTVAQPPRKASAVEDAFLQPGLGRAESDVELLLRRWRPLGGARFTLRIPTGGEMKLPA